MNNVNIHNCPRIQNYLIHVLTTITSTKYMLCYLLPLERLVRIERKEKEQYESYGVLARLIIMKDISPLKLFSSATGVNIVIVIFLLM